MIKAKYKLPNMAHVLSVVYVAAKYRKMWVNK